MMFPASTQRCFWGHYGAEVIKVEDTASSNPRQWYPPDHRRGKALTYCSANENKRDIALNLKTEGGLEVFYRLAKNSHVLVETFQARSC